MTEWFKQLLHDVNPINLGAWPSTIKRSINIDQNILAEIGDALEKRKYVTHHFFRYHNFVIHCK
jgi:hypothetical protein